MLARRADRLEQAATEAGNGAVAVRCDVTDPVSCSNAIGAAAETFGGIDSLVFCPAISPLVRLADTDADTWRRVLDVNVVGAAMITTAAVSHLEASGGRAVYLSSVSASQTAPWPGLGAYTASKAALDKLVEAWQAEHPTVGFTRLVVGDCAGGEGDAGTGLADDWNTELAAELMPAWLASGLMSGELIDVDEVVEVVDALLRRGPGLRVPTVVLTPATGA